MLKKTDFLKNCTIVCILFCLSLCSCKKEPEHPPVPIDKMKHILLDLQLAETYSLGLGPDSTISRFSKNYDSLEVFYFAILNHYHLSFAQFNEALKWYKARPEQSDSLLSLVLDGFHVMQSAFHIPDEGGPELKKKGNDSVNSRISVTDRSRPLSPDTSRNKRRRDSILKLQLPKPPVLSAPDNE